MKKNFSVITTVFNDSETIIELLTEVCVQTLCPNEIIIVDGGSTDNTCQLIKKFAANSKVSIVLIEGENLNISQGFNTAIRKASYDIVGIVATGNHYPRDCFEILVEKVGESEVEGVFFPIVARLVNKFTTAYGKAFLDQGRGLKMPSNHGIVVLKRVFDKYGYFCENFVYAGEDGEFYTRIPKDKLLCIPDRYVEWEVPKNIKQFKKQIRDYTIASEQIYGFPKAIFNFIVWKVIVQYFIVAIFFLLSFVSTNYYIKAIFCALWGLMVLYIFRKGALVARLKFIQEFYKVVYMFEERKYFLKQYRVRR